MSFDRPSASRLRLALLVTAALSAVPAFAQTTPPKPAPAKPAAPAAPAQQTPAQPASPPAQQGPTVVQVKPEPSQPDWVKVCGKDQGSGREICYTTRDFVSDQGQPVLAVAMYDVKGNPEKISRFILPLGLLLSPGIRFGVDSGPTVNGTFAICLPNGCFAEGKINEAFINSMKKGTTLNVRFKNQVGSEVTFQVPLAGFGKAF